MKKKLAWYSASTFREYPNIISLLLQYFCDQLSKGLSLTTKKNISSIRKH